MQIKAPATNIIAVGELLTTIAITSKLLPAFKFVGEGCIFVRSTPELAEFAVELLLEDWEYAYRSCPNGKLRIVEVTSIVNTGNMIPCFSLRKCI